MTDKMTEARIKLLEGLTNARESLVLGGPAPERSDFVT